MRSVDVLREAERILRICNACRYCEGFCAVFPAIERRRAFSEADLKYLANLCHNCRDCYYACQYSPPHEFNLNVPKVLAELRMEIYGDLAWPSRFSCLFERNGLRVWMITSLCVIIVSLLAIMLQGFSTVFSSHSGEAAFYKVVPYWVMVFPMSALGIAAVAILLRGGVKFWSETEGDLKHLFDIRANARAVLDALWLRYLRGAGYGCNYPKESFSQLRRWLHHTVFYGLLLCFASTATAAYCQHFLRKSAPYPFWSWPVALGTIGGIALLVGSAGLLLLKRNMDKEPAAPNTYDMDVGFLLLLLLTSLTGLLLLVLRETSLMGILLAVHLGMVAGLFITLPYSKLVHGVYRYASLLKNAIEESMD